MKRSVNFGGNKATARRKALRPRNLLTTMDFLGMSKDEQKSFLRRAQAGCGCGPTDACQKCSPSTPTASPYDLNGDKEYPGE